MTLLFLNQYGPDDPSPTARLLRDLVEELTTQGHHVKVIAASSDYRQRPARGWKRWRRELWSLFKMLVRGLLCRPRPDVVISFSSPPGLLVLAAFIAKRHKAKSIHWALDLYPDLALALGELSSGPLATRIETAMLQAYRRTDRVITLDTDMQSRLRTEGIESAIIAPWTPLRSAVTVTAQPASPPCWIYSGNLGRAHEWESLLRIQLDMERRHPTLELVFQGGGAARAEAQSRAEKWGLKRCRWRDYVAEDQLVAELLKARVLVATQRLETLGMLWPSKLALLHQLPRPVLWIGPTEGATAHLLANHANAAVFSVEELHAAASWLLNTVNAPAPESSSVTVEPNREPALKAWREVVASMSAEL